MNESDWLNCTDPERMLSHLAAAGVAARQVRWYTRSCLNQARSLLEDLWDPDLWNGLDRFSAGVSDAIELVTVLPPVQSWPADVHELALAITRYCIEQSTERVREVLADAALRAYAAALAATETFYRTVANDGAAALEGVFRTAWAEAWDTDGEITWLDAWDDVAWIAAANHWPDLLALAAMTAGLTEDYPEKLPKPIRWPPAQQPSSLPWSGNAGHAETGELVREQLAEGLGLASCFTTDHQGPRRELDPIREWQQRKYALLLRRNVPDPFEPEGRRERERRERLVAQLDTFRGQEAIARELRLISRVKVDAITADTEALRVHLTLIPTPGLCNARRRNSWVMYGGWSVWGFSEDLRHWTLAYIGTLQFDPELIAALVRSGRDCAEQPYDANDVYEWIRSHRRDELAVRLDAGATTLYCEDRPIASLTAHDLTRYPNIRSRYALLDFDPELRDALRRYAISVAIPALRPLRHDGMFLLGWWVDAAGGRIRTLMPNVDLHGEYLTWSDQGRAE